MLTPLASIHFSDPLMLIGLLAGAIPIALHLLNRIRSPIIPFPTLRFLKITAQKTSRRRQIQSWLLLLLRVAVFAIIAMALASPLIHGGRPSLAYSLILLLLLGAALLTLAAVFLATALDQRQSTPAPDPDVTLQNSEFSIQNSPRSPSRYFALSSLALLLGILAAAFAVFGLSSDTFFSGSSTSYSASDTACIIILDNSPSMLAKQDSSSRLQRAQAQTRQLLVDTIKPTELAILPTNPGNLPTTDHLSTDITAALGSLTKLETIGKTRSIKRLLRDSVELLRSSNQPNKMIIILSDMARPAFADADTFSILKDNPETKNIQIVLMPQSSGSPPADVGIASFTVTSGQPVIGNEILFEAQIVNSGDATAAKNLQLFVDDQPVPSVHPLVQPGPASRITKEIPYRLNAAGYHRFRLELADKTGAMDWDKQRELVLNVAKQINVLVVGPAPRPRPGTAAHYVLAALDPYNGRGATAGKTPTWSIAPTYKSADQTAPQSLTSSSAVFLCDIPRIPAPLADALAAYVENGGRLVWILGPSIDPVAYNADLYKQRHLLPADLGPPALSPTGSTVDWVDLKSDIFTNLFDNQEPFRSIVVTGHWTLPESNPKTGRLLSKLADNSPLITQHILGHGEIYTVLTAPSANWTNLAATVSFLPIINRMALGDSGRIRTETSFEPGQQVEIPVASENRQLALDVQTPNHETIDVRPKPPGMDRLRWVFTPTLRTGAYTWQSVDRQFSGQFVVNPPADEVDLVPADTDQLAKESSTAHPTLIAATPADLLAQLQHTSAGFPLMPFLITLTLILTILESLLANRYKPSIKIAPTSETPTRAAA